MFTVLHTSVGLMKGRKKTKILNLNNHVPHLTKCTIWKKFKAHEKVANKRKVQKKAENISIDTIKHHTQPRISNGKVTKPQESTTIGEPRGQPLPSR